MVVAAAVTGVGLSGFFDGILLHQVLQWHHLLSLLPGETWRDLENQILADGLFHVLMYAVTAAGLVLLWRARGALGELVGGREVGGGFLIGFGAWNVVDVVGFHWVLGLHRIRVDVPDPLIYDLGWLGLLGLVPLVSGALLLRKPGRGEGGRSSAALLGLAALIATPLAGLPPPGTRTALVLFDAGKGSAAVYAAVHRAGATILWMNPEGTIVAVGLEPGSKKALHVGGATLVTRSPALAGCLAALKA
jgi:uncharacterized membrane protein